MPFVAALNAKSSWTLPFPTKVSGAFAFAFDGRRLPHRPQMVRCGPADPQQFGLDDEEGIGWETAKGPPVMDSLGRRRGQPRYSGGAAQGSNNFCCIVDAGHGKRDHSPSFFDFTSTK